MIRDFFIHHELKDTNHSLSCNFRITIFLWNLQPEGQGSTPSSPSAATLRRSSRTVIYLFAELISDQIQTYNLLRPYYSYKVVSFCGRANIIVLYINPITTAQNRFGS